MKTKPEVPTLEALLQSANVAGLTISSSPLYADCYCLLRDDQALVCGSFEMIDRRLRALAKGFAPFKTASGKLINETLLREQVATKGGELPCNPYDEWTPWRFTDKSDRLIGPNRRLLNGSQESGGGMTLEEAWCMLSNDCWQNKVI